MEELELVNMTKNEECSCCGSCCSHILPMLPHEYERIKKAVDIGIVRAIRSPNYWQCPFFCSIEGACKIYPIRPEVCRVFICNMNKEEVLKEIEKVNTDDNTQLYNINTFVKEDIE